MGVLNMICGLIVMSVFVSMVLELLPEPDYFGPADSCDQGGKFCPSKGNEVNCDI